MADKTKIDWCDASWNPVTGCEHRCPYCYAKGIAERFGKNWLPDENPDTYKCVLDGTETHAILELDGLQARKQKNGKIAPAAYPLGFTPTLHRYKLDEPQRWTKPRNIFVCSMADLFGAWVPDEWIIEVFKACQRAPQHRYLFLTKNPARYASLKNPADDRYNGLLFAPNCGYGATATSRAQLVQAMEAFYEMPFALYRFLSIEPICDNLEWLSEAVKRYAGPGPKARPGWVIFGAESGNRKNKVIPQKEWVDNAVQMCRNIGAAVFMKDSLREIMGGDFIQEYPWS